MLRASSRPSSGATTALAVSGLLSERGDSSAACFINLLTPEFYI